MHNEGVSFYVAAGIPEFSAFNSIARRPKSALRSSVKVHLRCAYHPRSISLPLKLVLNSRIDQPLCSTRFDNGFILIIRYPQNYQYCYISFFILQNMGQNHFIFAIRYSTFGSKYFFIRRQGALFYCLFFVCFKSQIVFDWHGMPVCKLVDKLSLKNLIARYFNLSQGLLWCLAFTNLMLLCVSCVEATS